jgi:hypothetical protein
MLVNDAEALVRTSRRCDDEQRGDQQRSSIASIRLGQPSHALPLSARHHDVSIHLDDWCAVLLEQTDAANVKQVFFRHNAALVSRWRRDERDPHLSVAAIRFSTRPGIWCALSAPSEADATAMAAVELAMWRMDHGMMRIVDEGKQR